MDFETIAIIVGLVFLIAVVAFFIISRSYTVVKAHEAHIVVRRRGRKIYCSRQGEKSAYWYVPYFMQRSILPLENIKLVISNIPLRDIDMAKFAGDVRCWLNIENPDLAAEKLGRVETDGTEGFPALQADVKDLIEAVARNSSMKMDVVNIMKDRDKFSQIVKEEVAPILRSEWGIKIAGLEVIYFRDIEGYTVIKDIEARQAKLIETETRKQLADYEKNAAIVEAIANQEKETQRAEAEQTYRIRQVLKDQRIGQSEQEKQQEIAKATQQANKETIEATRVLTVGQADINKQATVVQAEGEAQANIKRAEGQSQYTKLTGFAEADVNRQKLFAEAEGTEKKALALKQYNEAGLSLEVIRANITIKQAQFAALSEGLKVAKINLVTSGESNILGIPVSAETGADLGAMLVALSNQGIDVSDLLKKLPLSETLKLAIAAKAGISIAKEGSKEASKDLQPKGKKGSE
ncbi:MAG TPA: hypothetical protein VMW36_09645 [Patescibacteria group bacterium]|nr:hypothetical protein [Patescibacteria group bacterium]